MDDSRHLLLEEVLSVAEGAQLGLLLLVFQLLLRRTEVEDEVLQGEDHPLQGQVDGPRGLALCLQGIQTPGGMGHRGTCSQLI